jgi:competence protein ComEA
MDDDPRQRLRIGPYAVAAVLAVVLALRFFGGGDDGGGTAVALDGEPPAGTGGRAPSRGHGAGTRVWVHVAGAVRHPGLYRVESTARAGVAVEAAGGVTRRADLTAINLAAPVKDGQQVIVPVRGSASAAVPGASDAGAGTAGGSSGGAGDAKISLSTATVEQLDSLDGIGPTLAQRIIDWREEHGGFKSVEQLREVDGIGETRFAALREAVVP